MTTTSQEVLLNDFAIRSFRDTADRDYIHARLAYRARLIPQFQWSGLHCLEKYAKGILLLNRISAKEVKHEISAALNRLSMHGKFKITLSEETQKFIKRLEAGAEYRYFEVSYANEGVDLSRLDLAVSEIRRYCQVLDFDIQTPSGTRGLLQHNLARIRESAEKNQREACIQGGWLERVLGGKNHPARNALIWQNPYFGKSNKQSNLVYHFSESANSPLDMHPEILDELVKYVFLPSRIEKEWRRELNSRMKEQI